MNRRWFFGQLASLVTGAVAWKTLPQPEPLGRVLSEYTIPASRVLYTWARLDTTTLTTTSHSAAVWYYADGSPCRPVTDLDRAQLLVGTWTL